MTDDARLDGEVKRLHCCRVSRQACQTIWSDLLLGCESQLKRWGVSERHSVPCPEARGRRTSVSFAKRTTRALGLCPMHTIDSTDYNYTVPTGAQKRIEGDCSPLCIQPIADGGRSLDGDRVDGTLKRGGARQGDLRANPRIEELIQSIDQGRVALQNPYLSCTSLAGFVIQTLTGLSPTVGPLPVETVEMTERSIDLTPLLGKD